MLRFHDEPSSEDNQEHMMDCKVLKERANVDGNYPDIFRKMQEH